MNDDEVRALMRSAELQTRELLKQQATFFQVVMAKNEIDMDLIGAMTNEAQMVFEAWCQRRFEVMTERDKAGLDPFDREVHIVSLDDMEVEVTDEAIHAWMSAWKVAA